MALDASGNLYVANILNNTVSKFAPGSTTPTATLTGLQNPQALAFDGSGNLYVANVYGNSVSEFAAGSTTPTATLNGVTFPCGLAFDPSGNLYVAGLTVRFQVFARSTATPSLAAWSFARRCDGPISLGGTSSAVAGVSLTDAEFAQIFTTSTGTVTIGDSGQTGNITFTTATMATTARGLDLGHWNRPAARAKSPSTTRVPARASKATAERLRSRPGTGGIVALVYAAGIPLASQGFTATGLTLTLSLQFAPTAGTQLTIISNTATASTPISGTFANVAQGGSVTVSYNGTPYTLVANYAGGDGNDLVFTNG